MQTWKTRNEAHQSQRRITFYIIFSHRPLHLDRYTSLPRPMHGDSCPVSREPTSYIIALSSVLMILYFNAATDRSDDHRVAEGHTIAVHGNSGTRVSLRNTLSIAAYPDSGPISRPVRGLPHGRGGNRGACTDRSLHTVCILYPRLHRRSDGSPASQPDPRSG